MDITDLTERYQAMDDGELLALAAEPYQLTPEAQTSLRRELAKRRINPNAVSEDLREEVKARNSLERHWNPEPLYFYWPGLRWFVATIRDWRKFRRQTGQTPTPSILTYFLHLIFALLVVVLLVWYAVPRHWSSWVLLGLFLPLAIADSYLSDWLLGKVRMSEIARYRFERRPKR